jgi:hypothetical protein
VVARGSVCRRDELVRLSAANNWLLRCAGARRRLDVVNRRHSWRSQEVGRTAPRQAVRRCRLSTIRSVGWGTGVHEAAPLRRVPAAVPRVRPSVRRPRETRRSTTDPAPCKPPPSATSWLRGHDSAPHWGSCGKPPSALYVRNGGAVSSGYGGAKRSTPVVPWSHPPRRPPRPLSRAA